MSNFYIYSKVLGNSILYRGYEGEKQICEKREFSPTLFVPSKTPSSEWNSLYDNIPLDPVVFGDIKEAKEFIKTYEDVQGIEVHGFQKFEYAYINQEFPKEVEYDISKVNILTLDIEVVSDGEEGDDESFPDIQSASTPIVLISYHSSKTNKTVVLGLKPYENQKEDDFQYIEFTSEKELLKHFICFIQSSKPDIVTGWNIDQFDIPYIINRIIRLFDENMAKKLSPFNYIREKPLLIRGKTVQTYEVYGLITLDLLECYRKFGSYNKKESYALGFIAQEELGKTKSELPGLSFRDNYNNFFQKFVQYSAIDTILVKKLDEKLKLIELMFTIAFMYKCNLNDVYKTVVPWEVFIFNHLHSKKIPIPPRRNGMVGEVEGAWVKTPIVGMHGWTMSFDFNALYPNIIFQWNISPETFVPAEFDVKVADFLNITTDGMLAGGHARKNDFSIAANGSLYRKDKFGFLAELVNICMSSRKIAKKEMINLEKEFAMSGNKALLPKISSLDAKQKALKVAANSVYGAIGNEGFMFYEYRIAEAITLTGQLSDLHLAKTFNIKINKIMKTVNTDYVLYGDTDSLLIDCQPIVDKFMPGKTRDEIVKFLDKFGEDVAQPIINDSVDTIFNQMNCKTKVMNSKREAIASKAIFIAKKKYAMYVHNSEGIAYNPPKIKAMGLEIVRSSTPQWCRKKLKDSLQMIFETSEEEFRENFKKIELEFKEQPPDVIAFPRGISDIDKYVENGKLKKGAPINVRAAFLYNEHTKKLIGCPQIQNGDRIKFLYMKLPNPIRENIFGFPVGQTIPKELKLEKYVDYDTQFFKTFESPLKALTDAAGWKLREVSTLEGFF